MAKAKKIIFITAGVVFAVFLIYLIPFFWSILPLYNSLPLKEIGMKMITVRALASEASNNGGDDGENSVIAYGHPVSDKIICYDEDNGITCYKNDLDEFLV